MLELATLGAQVLNNRSVEMAKKYALPYLLIDKEYNIDTDNLL